MRFAITATDRYLGVFERLVAAGWRPLKLFTVPLRHELGGQAGVIAFAERHGAAIQLSPMTLEDLRALQGQACEALVVASYDWKIPDWRPFLKYAVNIHASPLPDARGPYPAVRAILEERRDWAVTCHKLSAKMDAGDILAAEAFPLRPDECHESLDLKVQMAAKRLATRIAPGLQPLWDAAEPQGPGHYWPRQTLTDRIIDFTGSVEAVTRHIRAFGATESLALVNGAWLLVKRAVGWTETHDDPPGRIVHVYNRAVVVAASDGYVGLLESQLAPQAVLAQLKAGASQAGAPAQETSDR